MTTAHHLRKVKVGLNLLQENPIKRAFIPNVRKRVQDYGGLREALAYRIQCPPDSVSVLFKLRKRVRDSPAITSLLFWSN